ncbi:hypothetical protein JCM6882_000959 [Rhodosporidiobolus microsporus]
MQGHAPTRSYHAQHHPHHTTPAAAPPAPPRPAPCSAPYSPQQAYPSPPSAPSHAPYSASTHPRPTHTHHYTSSSHPPVASHSPYAPAPSTANAPPPPATPADMHSSAGYGYGATSPPRPPPGARPAAPYGQQQQGGGYGAASSGAGGGFGAGAGGARGGADSSRAEPEWRESSFISSFYGGGGGGGGEGSGTPGSSNPASPSRGEYFVGGGAPPASPPVSSSSGVAGASGPAYPSYAVARSATVSSSSASASGSAYPSYPSYPSHQPSHPSSSYSSTAYARPTAAPPLPPSTYTSSSSAPSPPPVPPPPPRQQQQPVQRPSYPQPAPVEYDYAPTRQSIDSVSGQSHYSLYSYGGSEEHSSAGRGAGSPPPPPVGAAPPSHGPGGGANGFGAGLGGVSRSASVGTFASTANGHGSGHGQGQGYGYGYAAPAYPSRKQSLEHLPAQAQAQGGSSSSAAANYRSRLDSLSEAAAGAGPSSHSHSHTSSFPTSSSTSTFASYPPPSSSSSSSAARTSASTSTSTGATSLSPRPTILMSPPPPLSPSAGALDSPDLSPSSVAPQHLHRNRSIDSAWTTGAQGQGQTQTPGPGPSPSYPTFASSFTNSGLTSSPEVSRRPSVASTLSPTMGYGGSYPASFGRSDSLTVPSSFSYEASSTSPSSSHSHSSHAHPFAHSSLRSNTAFSTATTTSGGAGESFLNPAFLSHLAVYLKDHVPRRTLSKPAPGGGGGRRFYRKGFTGEDVVETLVRALPDDAGAAGSGEGGGGAGLGIGLNGTAPSLSPAPSPSGDAPSPSPAEDASARQRRRTRAAALEVARTLHRALWFHEVGWSEWPVEDTSDAERGVYTFLLDAEVPEAEVEAEGEELDGEEVGVETPTGVLVEWGRCYSPFCGMLEKEGQSAGAAGAAGGGGGGEGAGEGGGVRVQGCYSYSCPNRRRRSVGSSSAERDADGALHRTGSNLSAMGGSGGVEPIESAENWATSVPPSVLEALSKKEIALQNNIFELISGEQQYLDDLGLLETGFIEPLTAAQPPIIPPSRLPSFLSSILLNHRTVRSHSSSFLSALRAKQAEAPVVSGIGKVVFSAALEWEQAYHEYGVQFELAGFLVREEMDHNPRFKEFVLDFRRHPSARRNELDYFLRRIVQRHSRYPMQLETILKHTEDDGTAARTAEIEYLKQAYAVVHQQLKDISRDKEEVDKKVKLREFNRDLVRKQGDMLDLELLDDSRRFFRAERVFRRPEGSGFTDQFQEAHLILFDNYLVLTKAPREDRDGRTKYPINRRPVPLDLVQLKTSSFSEPPIPRSSGFHLRSNRSAGAGGGSAHAGGYPLTPASTYSGGADLASAGTGATFATAANGGGGATASGPLVYPITFYQLGRFDGLVHVYVDTPAARAAWEKALKEAISLRLQRSELSRVVRLEPLADTTFGTTSLSVGSLVGAAGGVQGNQFGKPTCSVPLRTVDGLWLVIAGCAEGIFIGWRGRPKTMQQVVHLAGITQCAVLPEFSFLLVIANKVLVAYALEALIPSKTGGKLDQASKAPQRLSGQKDVSFFKVGKIGDQDARTLVIYAKKSGVKESVFKALEPVSQAERARGGGGGGHRFLGLGGGRPEWFRTYKEFFMPSLVTGLHFQRSKLALIGSRGVEIMDLESMRTMTVPDFPSPRGDRSLALLAKRCEDSSTMGLFRIGDSKFLLVYSDFAFHVGRHGEPVDGPFIEWESKPEQIAYCAPYIFAISPTLVEIRHAFTGRLAQFIIGSHMYLTYDGSAIPTPGPDLRPDSELAGPVERRLHLSMRQGQFHVLHEVVIAA